MADLLRTFIAGRMNKDLDERLLPDGEYRDAVNVTIDTSEGSNIGAVQNAYGNEMIASVENILISLGINLLNPFAVVTIGAVSYEPDNVLYWFVVSPEFEGIFEYNQITNSTVVVLGSTTQQLGFDPNHLITGVNYVTDGNGGGLLLWTDNLNQPRKINVNRCKTYAIDDPRISEDINLIVKPPLHSPAISLKTLANPNLDPNNIEDKFVYFSYRYKYLDNEYSSMSPMSAVAFDPKILNIDIETGENKGMLNQFNQVEITFETGDEFVKEIQLLVWESRTLNVKIIENLNKEELGIQDNSTESFFFMNNKTYAALPSDQATRLFDNVPLKALSQEIIGSRLIFGNYTQFRDLIDTDGGFIDVNYAVNYTSTPVVGLPKQTWRSDRDYEIGVAYLDEYGRMTTVLTTSSQNSANDLSNSVYIPSDNSDTANSLVVSIKNKAPEWATGYRLFVKQAKGEYYNIFPVTFLKQGNYRYLLINEADRDKIKVNGYVIFKSSAGLPTHSNKKFKVLELDYKAAGFISGALEGLYFKIKADASDTFLDAITQQSYTWNGTGRGPKPLLCSGNATQYPVENRVLSIPGAVYYPASGINNPPNPYPFVYCDESSSSSLDDVRITIEIVSATTFRWTIDVAQAWWIADLNLDTTPITLATGNTSVVVFFDSDGSAWSPQYNIGDKFVFNVRGTGSYAATPLQPGGNRGLPPEILLSGNTNEYGGHVILKGPGAIFPGAVISINILNDGPSNNAPGQNASSMTFPASQAYYKNIEEWFWQSGAYLSFVQYDQNGNNINATAVTFRDGTFGVNLPSNYMIQGNTSDNFMLIRGFGENSNCYKNLIQAELKVTQTPPNAQLTAETAPTIDDTDIYYEMSRTYPIEAGWHQSLWHYDISVDSAGNALLIQNGNKNPHYFEVGQFVYITAPNIAAGTPFVILDVPNQYSIIINTTVATTQPGGVSNNDFDQDQTSVLNNAVIVLNNTQNKNSDYNAYCYGNGVESNRILDGYNEPWLKYSLRANGIIEDYQQQIKDTSLTYSGLYRWDSSINRLNEFNLSVANFKNLDKGFGSVQKLYARTTDLVVLHQDKITSVLYGKNLLVDAVGGGSVASVPEVLGTQIALPYDFGISTNPESFAVWSNRMYFTDARRGVVLQMQGDEVIQISRLGLSDYFRDIMLDSSNYAKIGAYDPYNHAYVIAATNRRNTPCDITINPNVSSVPYNTAGALQYMFSISGTTAWSVSLVDNGFGINWVEIPAYCQTGVGAQDVSARVQNNLTAGARSIIFRVSFCSTSVDFTLTQGRGPRTDFNVVTYGKYE